MRRHRKFSNYSARMPRLGGLRSVAYVLPGSSLGERCLVALVLKDASRMLRAGRVEGRRGTRLRCYVWPSCGSTGGMRVCG